MDGFKQGETPLTLTQPSSTSAYKPYVFEMETRPFLLPRIESMVLEPRLSQCSRTVLLRQQFSVGKRHVDRGPFEHAVAQRVDITMSVMVFVLDKHSVLSSKCLGLMIGPESCNVNKHSVVSVYPASVDRIVHIPVFVNVLRVDF